MSESLISLTRGVVRENPVWVQMLGLCPAMAVTTSVANGLGLAIATLFVLVGSNVTASAIPIPERARLPALVFIIASFTTTIVLLLEAFAFTLYERIALYVQIIVTNCVILARADGYARQKPPHLALLDALGAGLGFAFALLALSALREVLGSGTLFAGMEHLFGETAQDWEVRVLPEGARFPLALLPPGAFLIAGLAIAVFRPVKHSG